MEMKLKQKYLTGKRYKATKSTKQGNSGGRGRAARRCPGWRKHGKTAANYCGVRPGRTK